MGGSRCQDFSEQLKVAAAMVLRADNGDNGAAPQHLGNVWAAAAALLPAAPAPDHARCSCVDAWNNGKEVPRLDLTSSTTPGQQIHYGRTNPDSKKI